jgi:hypothetical protein
VVFVLVLKVNQSENLYLATSTGCLTGPPLEQAPTNISPYTYTLYMTLTLGSRYRLSDWFTFRTSTNTTNVSPYTYTLYMTFTLLARYRLSDWFTFRTRDVGGVCACSKGEPVRQSVPSHEGERHVQCTCIGRDVGGVCACS